MFRLAAPPSRRASAGEIAEVYCFLASEEASFVSGALFLVDGAAASKPVASSPRGK